MQTRCEESRAQGWPWASDVTRALVCLIVGLLLVLASINVPAADDPEVVLQKKTRAELLRHALARLSPEHGEVIDLVYFHGKSVKEVAEIVGIAEATVKTRMFYARKKLAELVATA